VNDVNGNDDSLSLGIRRDTEIRCVDGRYAFGFKPSERILTIGLQRVNDARLFRFVLQNIRQRAIQNDQQFLLLCLYILIVTYVLFCTSIFCCHRAKWHSSATLTEDFPCYFLSCKANARV